MMKKLLYLLAVPAAFAMIVAMAVPRPGTYMSLKANATQDSLTATWTYKSPGWLPGDTLVLKWAQRKAADTAWTVLTTIKIGNGAKSNGPRFIALPPSNSFDSIRVQGYITRPTTTNSPTSTFKLKRLGPIVQPSPGIDSLGVALFIIDGNLGYTRTGYYNVADYKGTDISGCDLTSGTIDALGRNVTGCRLVTATGTTTAYTYVDCVVVERYSQSTLQFVTWAYPSSIVSDCLTKAAPMVAAKYGSYWRPDQVPIDSIAFQVQPTVKVDSTRFSVRSLAALK